MELQTIQRDFSLLISFSNRVEAAVAQSVSLESTLLHSVAHVAYDTRKQLEGLVEFDDKNKSWLFTQFGCDFIEATRKTNEKLALLIFGFLFGYYIANDPTIRIDPIAMAESDDDENCDDEDDCKNLSYYAYYSLMCDKHEELVAEISDNKLVTHGADYERLVTDIFGYDVFARQYRNACLAKASATTLNADLLRAIDMTASASFLFDTDFLHIVLGVYISAAR